MSGIVVIAKNELADILSSRVMLLIVLIYLVMIICSVYTGYTSVYNSIVSAGTVNSPGMFLLTWYGSLVAIALGISAMYSEVSNKALNTLVAKPVYRDTILNGKLLGALCFAICLFVLGALFNISLYYILLGSMFNKILPTFISQLSLSMALFLLSFMIFYLVTLFAYIILRDHCLSLFVGFSSWIFLDYILPDAVFSSYLAIVFSKLFNLKEFNISSLTDMLSPGVISFSLILNSPDFFYAISNNGPLFFPLLLYVVILLVLCYIVFMRRDME